MRQAVAHAEAPRRHLPTHQVLQARGCAAVGQVRERNARCPRKLVAQEVRSLAGRCADAVHEIKKLISASVDRVRDGSALVDRAGHKMHEVVESIRRVTDIVGEITSASGEQSQGVDQINVAVTQMDQTTQQNAALVEEMAAAATSLNQQATELVATVDTFKLPPARLTLPANAHFANRSAGALTYAG